LGSPNTLNLLVALHESTGETITLSMQNDFSMQFLRAIIGSFPISLRIGEGYMVPLFGTGVGNSLLASKTDAEIHTLVQRANSRMRLRADRIDFGKTLTEVQRTRLSGYCAAYDRLLAHTGAISMSLPATVEGSALVVAVAGLGDRIHRNEAQIIRTMRRLLTRHFPGRQIA
jgi:DNA-binding IclR family transcriptional regulator